MSLPALGSNASQALFQAMQQRREAMRSMIADVQAGDLSGAQGALRTFQTSAQTIGAALGVDSSPQSGNSTSGGFRAMSDLIVAIVSGSLNDAQSSLQSMQTDQDNSASSAADLGASSTSISPAASASTLLNDLDNLLSSILSGDKSRATAAGGALTNDVQSLTGSKSESAGDSGSIEYPFLSDLQSLAAAASNNNAIGEQQAAQNLLKDLQSAAPQGARVNGGHHHHGSHGGVKSTDNPSLAPDRISLSKAATQAYNSILQLAGEGSESEAVGTQTSNNNQP